MQSEQYIDSRDDNSSGVGGGFQLQGNEQSPFDAVAFADQMDKLLSNLNPQKCQILDLKLQHHTNDEIATQLGCSERTVRRIAAQIKERWSILFDQSLA